MTRIFVDLAAGGYLAGLPAAEFSFQAAHFLADINAVHPFRDGNGRTQLSFLAMMTENAGLPFNENVLQRDRVIAAMVDSFASDEKPLAQLIHAIVTG